ncbi:hypothetical protein KUCAC02_029751 [Chaenocephalus aceratus]|nr:hypothetical protein KUCAC02_029751 [Chaenocephalus aceratus]
MNSGTYGFAITREFARRAPWFFSHISTKRERAEVGATGGNFPLNAIKPFKDILKRRSLKSIYEHSGLLASCGPAGTDLRNPTLPVSPDSRGPPIGQRKVAMVTTDGG